MLPQAQGKPSILTSTTGVRSRRRGTFSSRNGKCSADGAISTWTTTACLRGLIESTNELTTGVNYYLHGQAAKFTLDVGWLPNGVPTDDDGAGILANHGPEYYLRGQFQLLL